MLEPVNSLCLEIFTFCLARNEGVDHMNNFILRLIALPLAIVTALALSLSVQAAPPKDTFVMAKDFSDIITLDPAEVFEFSGGEVIANIYDRLMMYEPENLSKLSRGG